MSTTPYPTAEQMFWWQYETVRRDEVVGVLLAIFLGCFGIHHFYVGRNGLGILYCCLFWTGIPAILGLVECFFMPGRVRAYNAMHAAGIAATLGIALPAYVGYAGWVAPGFNGGYSGQSYTGASTGVSYAQPDAEGYAPVYPANQSVAAPTTSVMTTAAPYSAASYSATPATETTLVVCENCRMTNPVGSRFCSGCGNSLS